MVPSAVEPLSEQHPLQLAREIAARVAARFADEVDTGARFPTETIEAAKRAQLLSAGLSLSSDGPCDVGLQASICFEMAHSCASSAMVLAMHYIQLDCLAAHHAGSQQIRDYLAAAHKEQRLIASVTSEVGIDGDLRRSITGIEGNEDQFSLTKQATTISYGQHADDFLISARASAEAAESDQRLVLALGTDTELQTRGAWDTLGMRGTVSPGGTISTRGASWQILGAPFAEIAAVSMVPLSHILWSACWLGIGHNAISRTRKAVQKKARRDADGTRIAAQRLTTIHGHYRQLSAEQAAALSSYTALLAGSDQRKLTGMAEAIRYNDLKLHVSEGIAEIVQQAIQTAGIAAYRNGTEFSLGRHLRDALSASLMINNDRIRAANADMQLVFKDR